MAGLTPLWLPIVLSAVFVFVLSSIIHMVLRYHRSDYGAIPGEAKALEVLRAEGITPGSYMFPYCADPSEMSKPEVKARYEAGPVGILHVLPGGTPAMGKYLALWFVYLLLVSFFTAYVAGHSLPRGAHYLGVFRIVGATAFIAYGIAEFSNSVWRGQTWSVTIKNMIDGLLFSLVTAGVFGWLWPSA